ncbi:MAG: hypothetical protein ACI957_005426 [Verrucomicrobiales bacterium]
MAEGLAVLESIPSLPRDLGWNPIRQFVYIKVPNQLGR